MFIEVYFVDAFFKTPLLTGMNSLDWLPYWESFSSYQVPYSAYSSMTILDPLDKAIYSSSSSSSNSTCSFTYEIPESAGSGIYKIVIQGSGMADSIMPFRIMN